MRGPTGSLMEMTELALVYPQTLRIVKDDRRFSALILCRYATVSEIDVANGDYHSLSKSEMVVSRFIANYDVRGKFDS